MDDFETTALGRWPVSEVEALQRKVQDLISQLGERDEEIKRLRAEAQKVVDVFMPPEWADDDKYPGAVSIGRYREVIGPLKEALGGH